VRQASKTLKILLSMIEKNEKEKGDK